MAYEISKANSQKFIVLFFFFDLVGKAQPKKPHSYVSHLPTNITEKLHVIFLFKKIFYALLRTNCKMRPVKCP